MVSPAVWHAFRISLRSSRSLQSSHQNAILSTEGGQSIDGSARTPGSTNVALEIGLS